MVHLPFIISVIYYMEQMESVMRKVSLKVEAIVDVYLNDPNDAPQAVELVMCILVDVMIKNDEITQKDMVSAIQQCGGLHNVDYITYGGAAICIKPLVESEVQ